MKCISILKILLCIYIYIYISHQTRKVFTLGIRYRCGLSSQVDLCFTNDIEVINGVEIMEKLPHSHHCPCVITLNPVYSCNLDFFNDCSCDFFNHYDINKRQDPSLKLEKCNQEYFHVPWMHLTYCTAINLFHVR